MFKCRSKTYLLVYMCTLFNYVLIVMDYNYSEFYCFCNAVKLLAYTIDFYYKGLLLD